MKRNVIFLLLTFTLNNAIAQISAKRVTVAGRIINSTATTPKVLGINFLNPFDNTRKTAMVDSLTEFSVQENMLFTQNMTISYNNTFINLYVVPGDSVHLEIDASLLSQPNFKWLTISGDHAKISMQLNLLHHYLSKLPYQEYNYSLSAQDMLTAIKKDYNRYMASLEEYTHLQDVDPIVINFFKRDVKYTISNWISDYVDAGSDSTSTRSERIALFSHPFFEYANDTNFVSMMYPYHLSYYMSWKTALNSSITAAKQHGRDREALHLGAEMLLKEPIGISRDYMLFSYISSYLNRTSTLYDEMPSLRKYFTDTTLYQYLELAVDRKRNIKVPKTILSQIQYMNKGEISTVENVDFLTLLSKKYPNKVIYLDLYATWCAPCLAEMEYAPALHQKFAGKDVVFVNLCLQSSAENWIKLVGQKKLEGENYFLNDDNTKLLMGNFNISGFPTYMLIDGKGEVKTTSASRPSELEKLKQEIQAIIE